MNHSSSTTRRTVFAVCCLLALAVAAVFGQTVRHEFINYDDNVYVYDNPQVAHGLTAAAVAWSFTSFHASNWHPLTWLSHATDCQLYGTHQPGLHHLTNVVLHAAVAISLFLVLWQMTGNLWASAFVAAVFAVHPLRAESVAWVAERKDLLSGLFFMLTLGAYLRYVRRPFSWARYLLVIAMFALGLMAKPMLVTLPFVLLLLDYWPLGRFTNCLDKPLAAWHATPVSRLLIEKIPLLMMAAVSCRVTSLAQHTAIIPVDMVPINARIVNALISYVAYIGQFFYPSGLALFYPYASDRGAALEGCRRRGGAGRHFRCRAADAAADALSVRRLVLVRGNARAGDRVGAGRVAGDGGPLHLLAADRAVHRRDLGRGRGGAEVPVRRKIRVLSSLGLMASLPYCCWRC